MLSHKKILVIDADTDSRVLLVGTLVRVFPQAAIVEVQDAQIALKVARTNKYDAIVAHRAIGADTQTLVRMLREARRGIPILAVAGLDQKKEVMLAGATRFLTDAEWLYVGTTVAEMLSAISPPQN